MSFTRVEPKPSFPAMEGKVLERWKSERTFERSIEMMDGRPEFIFYDGPPFPTGSPHHGTVFISVLKDVVGRYKTMRGFKVPRTWGWDCHGLPIETIAEKNLGLTEKAQIERELGVKAFNSECRSIVTNFNEAWKVYIDKIGRWVDMERPYRTLDRSFMESVLWAFAECYRKDLIYKAYRVSPYCYRCETPLSLSEIRVDDATRPRQDRAITVKFKVIGAADTYFLAWTTTPWTLPSNLALAVGADLNYVTIEHEGQRLILAEGALGRYSKEFGKTPSVVERTTGKSFLESGTRYEPLFPYFLESENAFRVITADFVSLDDGTGVVHMAPAFGEDDYWTCRAFDIGVQNPVDEHGCFTDRVSDFAGQNVHEANAPIIRFLKERGVVVRDETIEHNYPHCWRCRNPLIYRALDAWYFKIEAIKERLLETNREVNWYPETVKSGRFGNWLENARDWNISRNRYWATPIPVWICESCDERAVLGSGKEIEEKAGYALPDLHKEFLDAVTFKCTCGGTMKRVPEVLDCWFESGSMPYGQFHYPFENERHFKDHFPADFIVEYSGQIRCWFYYLHVLSTALFNRPAFKNCMVHGTLLASDGKKMSKSLKNYTDPLELMNRHGGDAIRSYLLSSQAVLLEDLSFRDDGVELQVKSILLPLWNALSFFTSYAEIDRIVVSEIALEKFEERLTELDRFILSECEILIERATLAMDRYGLDEVARSFAPFLDVLNNWYIRRSRDRVWSSDPRDPAKLTFFATLYRVLGRFTRVLAPFCPFIAESVWSGLGADESVHLSPWPETEPRWIDETLSRTNNVVREVVSAGLSIRSREKIRVRQPLSQALIASRLPVDLGAYREVIASELNVKDVQVLSDPGNFATVSAKLNAKVVGPRLGARVQEIIKHLKAGSFQIVGDLVTVGDVTLGPGEVEVGYTGKEGMAVESGAGFVVSLDTAITEELRLEGLARDLVRQIQELRKDADLNIADRIVVSIEGADEVLSTHQSYLARETLTVRFEPNLSNALVSRTVELDGNKVQLALVKALDG